MYLFKRDNEHSCHCPYARFICTFSNASPWQVDCIVIPVNLSSFPFLRSKVTAWSGAPTLTWRNLVLLCIMTWQRWQGVSSQRPCYSMGAGWVQTQGGTVAGWVLGRGLHSQGASPLGMHRAGVGRASEWMLWHGDVPGLQRFYS